MTSAGPHVFVVDVEDEPGVLTRVSSLFRRRAFNIVSLTVGVTERPGISRMTIVVDAPEVAARRIEAHLWKLVNVIRVEDVTGAAAVRRELVMVKVAADVEARTHVMKLAEVFRARVVDVAPDSLILESTGHQRQDCGPARRTASVRPARGRAQRTCRDGPRRTDAIAFVGCRGG